VKDLVADGVRAVLREPPPAPAEDAPGTRPAWFGSLRAYAGNAGGRHELAAMRSSVTRGRSGERPK
jgi:hypothetical protein